MPVDATDHEPLRRIPGGQGAESNRGQKSVGPDHQGEAKQNESGPDDRQDDIPG